MEDNLLVMTMGSLAGVKASDGGHLSGMVESCISSCLDFLSSEFIHSDLDTQVMGYAHGFLSLGV